MKYIITNLYVRYSIAFLITVLFMVGCKNPQPQQTSSPGGEVVVASKGAFPEFLVGVWKADKSKWAFKFEPDGSISKLVHVPADKVNMKEGGYLIEGPDPGTFALFVMGPYKVQYDANTRKLMVRIFVDRFHLRLPQGDLEGKSEDYFEGPVSEDGKTWNASWHCYSQLEGGDPPDRDLIDAHAQKLIFTKMDLDTLQSEAEKSNPN